MQFYNATDKELSLYHHTLMLLGISEDDTTTIPLDPTFTRLANVATRDVATLIWQNQNDWEWDDSNHTDLAIVKGSLVDSQKDYSIPDSTFDIMRVEIKDNTGDWKLLRKIDDLEIKVAEEEFHETDGEPMYWDVKYNSLFLYPAPSTNQTTLSNGLRLHLSRNIDAFTTSDTTQEPGFHENFHDLVALKAAYIWGSTREISEQVLIGINNQISVREGQLSEYYANRGNKKRGARFRPKHRNRI